ncbi:MAG: hypothetical protein ACYDBQ_08455 [Thermoplasmatota archaeon]
MTSRRPASPIPPEVMAKLRAELAPTYGAQVWIEEGSDPILVVRVPGQEPDLVNDLEAAVQYVSPSDLAAKSVLFLGSTKALMVSAQPLRDLMHARVQDDHRICSQARPRLKGPVLYRAPEDPPRLQRLLVPVAHQYVKDLDDADLDALALEVAPFLDDAQWRLARCVHLVAGLDDVRIETGLFLQDLAERVRRGEGADEGVRDAPQPPTPPPQPVRAAPVAPKPPILSLQERAALLADLGARYGKQVASAPLRSMPEPTPWEARTDVVSYVDALPEAPESAPNPEVPQDPTPAVPSGVEALRTGLESAGYAVLVHPEVPGHVLDLAAERPQGYPQRVIARVADRLTLAAAQELLATSRDLDVDLALAVAAEADPEAQKRLIATKAKWVTPAEVGNLHL